MTSRLFLREGFVGAQVKFRETSFFFENPCWFAFSRLCTTARRPPVEETSRWSTMLIVDCCRLLTHHVVCYIVRFRNTLHSSQAGTLSISYPTDDPYPIFGYIQIYLYISSSMQQRNSMHLCTVYHVEWWSERQDSRTELKNNQSESGQGQMLLKRSPLLCALFLNLICNLRPSGK